MTQLPFTKIDHVGLVAKDFDKVSGFLQSLGIGPFQAARGLASIERKLYGKPIALDSFKLKEQNAKVGAGLIQIIQPVEGKSVWKDFLDKGGEGIQHLGFIVDDVDREEAKLVERGVEVVYRSRFQGGGGAAYFDTSKVGGILFEIVQWPPQVDLGYGPGVRPQDVVAPTPTSISLDHLGVVVRDMDRAVEHYQSLGIGPFELLTGITSMDRRMWGKPVPLGGFKLNEKMAWIGQIRLQLIQPVEGDSPWRRFLEANGERGHHLSFRVDDIDRVESDLLKKGLKQVYRSRYQGGGGAANFETGAGGFFTEFIQWPPGFK